MTKNLKINIKNAQLAAVLDKSKLKKGGAEKDKAVEEPIEDRENVQEIKNAAPATEDTDQKPKKVVKARKTPSNMVPPSKSSDHDQENDLVEEIKMDESDQSSPSSTLAHETSPLKSEEQAKIDNYKPQMSEKIIKKKMIETPIVKKKESFQERQRREKPPQRGREQKPDFKPLPPVIPPPTEEELLAKANKKKNDRKKGIYGDAPEEGAAPKGDKDKAAKKFAPSYRRQAFSRVFDSRSIESEETWRRKRHAKQKKRKSDEPIVRPKEISVVLPITVKELAAQMKIKGTEVIQKLFLQGLPITINDALEDETTVELIGQEFECIIHIDKRQEERLQITELSIDQEIESTDPDLLETRPPVVTIMGHVDHGKTSIIDSFRKSNLTSGEAGAITQHIGAFQVKTKHGSFTVLDTPGHEAFSAIRARGAHVTDIIVLVVAGDEGIKPQTVEAIQKAKDAKVPIIVAINKKDKPGFNPDEVYRQLSEHELLSEAWGGDVLTVSCSAKTGEGIDVLAEMIALQSEVLELTANPTARARGTVLEAELHRGLGITATLLIQNGTLNVGDAIIFEHEYGKIKTMQDEHGKSVKHALPSMAVKVTGLSGVPASGSEFIMLADEKEARKISEERRAAARFQELKKRSSKSLEHMMTDNVERQRKKTLSIILKADVGGSLEAVRETLLNIPTDKVEINFVSTDVGQISESDIERASASGAIIVGFHTNIESHAELLLKNIKVKIIQSDIIYHLVDAVKEHMVSILDKIRQETEVASAQVQAIFKSSHLGNIAGCKVTEGVVKRSYYVRQYRDGVEIWTGSLSSLKRHQDDVKEVKKDMECGVVLNGTRDVKEGDELRFFEVTYITQEL